MKYAKTFEQARGYLKLNYDFDGEFKNSRGHTETHRFENDTVGCACGDCDGIWVYDESDEKNDLVEKIAICECCYDDASYMQQV